MSSTKEAALAKASAELGTAIKKSSLPVRIALIARREHYALDMILEILHRIHSSLNHTIVFGHCTDNRFQSTSTPQRPRRSTLTLSNPNSVSKLKRLVHNRMRQIEYPPHRVLIIHSPYCDECDIPARALLRTILTRPDLNLSVVFCVESFTGLYRGFYNEFDTFIWTRLSSRTDRQLARSMLANMFPTLARANVDIAVDTPSSGGLRKGHWTVVTNDTLCTISHAAMEMIFLQKYLCDDESQQPE